MFGVVHSDQVVDEPAVACWAHWIRHIARVSVSAVAVWAVSTRGRYPHSQRRCDDRMGVHSHSWDVQVRWGAVNVDADVVWEALSDESVSGRRCALIRGGRMDWCVRVRVRVRVRSVCRFRVLRRRCGEEAVRG